MDITKLRLDPNATYQVYTANIISKSFWGAQDADGQPVAEDDPNYTQQVETPASYSYLVGLGLEDGQEIPGNVRANISVPKSHPLYGKLGVGDHVEFLAEGYTRKVKSGNISAINGLVRASISKTLDSRARMERGNTVAVSKKKGMFTNSMQAGLLAQFGDALRGLIGLK